MIHLHVPRSDEEAEKLSLGYMKLTFLRLYVEMIVKESLEDPADMPLMLLQWSRENEDIIKIYEDELIKHVPENVIYKCLKYSVGEPKRHH